MNQTPNDDEITLKSVYIGTDYTYAYSQRFRDTIFRDNCFDEKLLIGVQDKPITSGENEN